MSRKITLQVDLVIPEDDTADEWADNLAGLLDEEYSEFKECRVMWS